jgi:drug/metabolite transporter (DMT)-like permease
MTTSIEDFMDRNNRNALIAAALFMLFFGGVAFYLPTIMIAVGNVSTIAAGAVAVLFVGAFFMVFWLRSRSQRSHDK